MPRITRRLEFDYGHRVLGHEGKCASLHGHRGVVEITVSAGELDSLGRVVDFSVVKSIVGGWIDDQWDHNMILHPHDPLSRDDVGNPRDFFIMPETMNPTAENLARVLFKVASELLESHKLYVDQVKFLETPNCWAVYP